VEVQLAQDGPQAESWVGLIYESRAGFQPATEETCRPYRTQIQFPDLPSTPPSAPYWAKLFRPFGTLAFAFVLSDFALHGNATRDKSSRHIARLPAGPPFCWANLGLLRTAPDGWPRSRVFRDLGGSYDAGAGQLRIMRVAQVFGSSPALLFTAPYQQTVASRVSKTARPGAPGAPGDGAEAMRRRAASAAKNPAESGSARSAHRLRTTVPLPRQPD
jgi:hypothetical protein